MGAILIGCPELNILVIEPKARLEALIREQEEPGAGEAHMDEDDVFEETVETEIEADVKFAIVRIFEDAARYVIAQRWPLFCWKWELSLIRMD